MPMTLENQILQQLGGGPIPLPELAEVSDEAFHQTIAVMEARRQICVRDQQVALFWHRHMIFSGGQRPFQSVPRTPA
ncbi:hypothetical protein [Sphingobium sp. KCTC 72723]|uniref:hypothetical protein n=1 Tax=Sphingobium sp. KCTC 72723 TaxID=2733867 RepID=UPI001CB75289|nr:hypothetical protein [Sphingobium sp. KCTC 72723]